MFKIMARGSSKVKQYWGRYRQSIPARLIALVAVIILILTNNLSYESYVAPRYAYMGMGYRTVEQSYVLSSWFYALAPTLLMPLQLRRASQIFLYVQYFIFYVPFVFNAYHVVLPNLAHREIFPLVTITFFSMLMLTLVVAFPVQKLKRKPMTPKSYWTGFVTILLTFTVYLLVTYRNNLKLVSFDDVYELRAAAGEATDNSLGGSRFTGYALAWLQGCLAPIAFAVAVFNRRWQFAVASASIFVLIYMIQGAKAALVAPLFTLFFFYWSTRWSKWAFVTLALGLSCLLMAPFLISALQKDEWNVPYLLLVHARAFSIPQMLTVQFYDFFTSHPPTNAGHIPGLNLISPYRYQLSIPFEIGWYYYGQEVGSNAGIWAGDGITSFGLIGIPIFTIPLIFLLRIIDALTAHLRTSFVVVSMAYLASIFGNVQLNIVIVTNGLFLALLCFWYMPSRGAGAVLQQPIEFEQVQ